MLSSCQGVKENSKKIGLEDKVKIDLLVVGSVAVSRNGRFVVVLCSLLYFPGVSFLCS